MSGRLLGGGPMISNSSPGCHPRIRRVLLANFKSLMLDYCTDLEELHKGHQDLSKGTHDICT